MRSRVHNRTSDRGGKPIQLAVVAIAPGPSLQTKFGRGPSPRMKDAECCAGATLIGEAAAQADP